MSSLENQVNWCKNTKLFLEELDNSMRSTARSYIELVNHLNDAGYIEEWMPEIRQMSNEYVEEAMALSNHLKSYHWDYANQQQQEIEKLL